MVDLQCFLLLLDLFVMENEVYAVLATIKLSHSFSVIVSADSKCCSWGCKMTSIIKIWLKFLIISLGVKIVSKQNESKKIICPTPVFLL